MNYIYIHQNMGAGTTLLFCRRLKLKELVRIPLEYCWSIFSLAIREVTAADARRNTRLPILSPRFTTSHKNRRRKIMTFIFLIGKHRLTD